MEQRIVLLLHGFLMSSRLWGDVLPRLSFPGSGGRGAGQPSTRTPPLPGDATGPRVLAPDLRGHGDAAVTHAVSVAEIAGDVQRLLDMEVGPAPVTVVGFSLGGYVALELLRAIPERVAGLVLVATRARADTPREVAARRDLALRVATAGTNTAVAAYLPRLFSSTAADALRSKWHDEMCETDPVGVIAALDAMASRPDAESVLADYDGPTRILVGEDDVLTPPSEAERMHELAQHSTLQVVAGAGHMLPVEAATDVARAISVPG